VVADVAWGGAVRGDRLVFHGTNVGGQLTLKVSTVEPLATTEVFSATVPASPPGLGSPFVYLRQQQQMVIGVSTGAGAGWAYLGAGGSVDLAYPPVAYTTDQPTAVGSNGRYRAHWYGYEFCDTSLPEGTPCDVTKTVVVYDNATGGVVDQFDPRLFGPSGLTSASAVGPAGELLLAGVGTGTWYLHQPGGATTAVGDYPWAVGAAFSVSGDKAYFGDPTHLVEVVLATGATRTLPTFGTPAVAAVSWTIELDALLYIDSADPEPRQLHRMDLASGAVTDVGTLPSSAWLYLVP
jgi:hypothetical protein